MLAGIDWVRNELTTMMKGREATTDSENTFDHDLRSIAAMSGADAWVEVKHLLAAGLFEPGTVCPRAPASGRASKPPCFRKAGSTTIGSLRTYWSARASGSSTVSPTGTSAWTVRRSRC